MKVEVAYATLQKQRILVVNVEPGTMAEQAVNQSNIVKSFPEIDLDNLKLGIFGKAVKNNHILEESDRIEIYRPLVADPKEVRRRKAAADKKAKEALKNK